MNPTTAGRSLHRNRTVMVRTTEQGERFTNDREMLAGQIAEAGPGPRVVVEATYGWYWAVDAGLKARRPLRGRPIGSSLDTSPRPTLPRTLPPRPKIATRHPSASSFRDDPMRCVVVAEEDVRPAKRLRPGHGSVEIHKRDVVLERVRHCVWVLRCVREDTCRSHGIVREDQSVHPGDQSTEVKGQGSSRVRSVLGSRARACPRTAA